MAALETCKVQDFVVGVGPGAVWQSPINEDTLEVSSRVQSVEFQSIPIARVAEPEEIDRW